MSRWKPLIWFGVSLLCFVAAMYFWQWGERRAKRDAAEPAEETSSAPGSSSATGDFHLVSQTANPATNAPSTTTFRETAFPYRLRNTPASMGELMRSHTALLLENALMDTARDGDLPIPDHLRSQGDAGTYIVQARGVTTEAFRQMIRAAGGSVVSYVPNNAYLVRASAGQVGAMEANPLTQFVLPFEPYYKLRGALLETAVKQKQLPRANRLSLVLFEDTRDSTVNELTQMGAVVLGEDRSPFGPVVKVRVPRNALPAVAALPGVQMVDGAYERALANDLSRARILVSANSSNAPNHLGLTGSNIVIQINDSGVDATHPDLTGRVTGQPPSLLDVDGHGTHVAGTIAGNGAESASVGTNAPGSAFPIASNQFRGMAPGATLFSVGAVGGAEFATDADLQESAATNGALISNNSWRQLGNMTYDIVAASYDAATRDALPRTNGSQPVLFVFAAGNEGFGNEDGTGGLFDTIGSPATAKNVITVGAIENFREITNDVVICETDGTNVICYTNSFRSDPADDPPFLAETDSDKDVASFSSRGNVGIGLEGEFGRYKPDVVAPGTAILSTRSDQWDDDAYYEALDTTTDVQPKDPIIDPILPGEIFNGYATFIETNTSVVEIFISTPPGQLPLPDLPIYVYGNTLPDPDDPPPPPAGTNSVVLTPADPELVLDDLLFFGVGNPTEDVVSVIVNWRITTTNSNPFFTQGLRELNEGVEPYYRFESGTSMSAPAISGALALLQEFLQERLNSSVSPALLKALVINGSRSLGEPYDFWVKRTQNNSQGWGVFGFTNVVPASTNLNGPGAGPIFFYDQSPTNALATGQSETRSLTLDPAAQLQPLRFTLVWTDPPGNPVVGAKLVNDLDLIVTNLDSGEVFVGNDIRQGAVFNEAFDLTSTNSFPLDVVNNVENVFVANSEGTNFGNFSVTVLARRVNVNAVYDHPDNTVQDYALVISSGGANVDDAITVTNVVTAANPFPEVNFLDTQIANSNVTATILESQRVGENTPLLGTTNGITNQWHFYVLTNSSGFSNAAFVTFLPSTLSIPRMGVFADNEDEATRPEADIDLYVSLNPALTNLDQAVLDAAPKSLGRGGTELVALSNALPGDIYYIGVKSEDHEAANYRFFGAFSRLPFSEDDNGDLVLRGVPVPFDIPDGTPSKPGAALILGLATQPIEVRRVVVTNEVSHENFGDLFGNLSHDDNFAVLNNHTYPDPNNEGLTNFTYIYEDNGEGDITGARGSDGPGSLRDFVGEEGLGVWLLTMLDTADEQAGRVDDFVIRLERNKTNYSNVTIAPRSWFYGSVDVPADATNLTISVEIVGAQPLPVELYIRQGDFPTFGLFDFQTTINPPGGLGSISIFDLPPLVPDRYYFGIFNPNAVAQTVNINILIELGLDQRDRKTFTSFDELPLRDNAVTSAYQEVTDDRRIAGLEVGLYIEHPRVSDLVTHLVSPTGKRVLLVENRGGTDTNGFGGGVVFTNSFPVTTNGGFMANTNTLDAGANEGTLFVDYDFLTLEDRLRVYYDGEEIFDTGLINGSNNFSVDFGPGLSTNLVITMNEDIPPDTNTIWGYQATVVGSTISYLVLSDDTNNATTPIKFAAPPLGGLDIGTTGVVVWVNDFEGATPGPKITGDFIDGWEVLTNDVEVLTGAAAALGVNYVDLNGDGTTTGSTDGIIETNVALIPGRSYVLTFQYARNPDSITNGVIPQAAALMNSNLVAVVTADQTNSWTNLNWQSFSATFVASVTNESLQFASLTTNGIHGVLFDDVKIFTSAESDLFYFPEESFESLIGDDAEGLWELEVWDNRAGASNGPPTLKSWQLRFIYDTIVQVPVSLEPGLAITNTIPPGEIFQLVVDVPNWASYATNTLIFATNDPVNVWVNPTNVITADPLVDELKLLASIGGNFLLDAGSIPPLQPGGRYFVGIENPSSNTVTFAYRVDFDITALSNGVPYSDTLGTNQFGGFIRYFSYDVSTNNPTAVTFDLFNLDGDVDLLASFGQLPRLLPGFYDYGSFNFGTNAENITVFPDSTPVNLAPGRWYLAVVLAEPAPVNYTIQATELTNDFSGIITLTNAIPYANTNNGVAPIEDYYRFMVTDPVQRLQFEILGPTADMTLLVNKGLPLPSFANFDYLSANPGTNDEYILVLPGSTPVAVSAGEWFLTALNLSGQAGAYSIKATQWAQSGQPITLGQPSIAGGNFCFTWNSLIGGQYVVQAKVALSDTNWVDISPTITATGLVTGYCVPLTSPYRFFQVIEGVAVDAGSAAQIRIGNISVVAGSVTLDWQAPPTFQFEVQFKDSLAGPWNTFPGGPITSTDGNFTFTDPGPLPPVTRFYRIVLLP